MTVNSFFPILVSADLSRLLPFYIEGLGATAHYRFPTEGAPEYVGLHLAGQSLGIGRAPDVPAAAGRISLWIYVDDCDAVTARLADLGGTVTEPPADQPWGERVAKVIDPDGNELIIGQAPEGER